MAIEILRDLRGLHVEVMHAPDADRVSLVEHLQRIGCVTRAVWPLPDGQASKADLVLLAIDHDMREPLRRLFRDQGTVRPTVIGIVEYENPSMLQLALEIGTHAVIERPVRPFGLLTQLVIARSLWSRQQAAADRVQKLERKLAGTQNVQRARLILMANDKLTEAEAYQAIRSRAMARRIALEDMAAAIIQADNVVRSRLRGL